MALVLVIDDDTQVRNVIVQALKRAGHEVLQADNGRTGVEIVRRDHPDLVITDLVMPDQEGIETIVQLHDLDGDLPIIAISGSGGEGGFTPLDDARMLGASLTLAKPFAMADLMSAVTTLLGRLQP